MSDEQRYRVLQDSYLPDMLGLSELVAREGEVVYRYIGPTYGVIDHANGIACCRNGPRETPFFEVPRRNLEALADHVEETP